MKVISVSPDGSALVEFGNLRQHTKIVGVDAPIQAVVDIASIPKLLEMGRKGRRAGQKLRAFLQK